MKKHFASLILCCLFVFVSTSIFAGDAPKWFIQNTHARLAQYNSVIINAAIDTIFVQTKPKRESSGKIIRIPHTPKHIHRNPSVLHAAVMRSIFEYAERDTTLMRFLDSLAATPRFNMLKKINTPLRRYVFMHVARGKKEIFIFEKPLFKESKQTVPIMIE